MDFLSGKTYFTRFRRFLKIIQEKSHLLKQIYQAIYSYNTHFKTTTNSFDLYSHIVRYIFHYAISLATVVYIIYKISRL